MQVFAAPPASDIRKARLSANGTPRFERVWGDRQTAHVALSAFMFARQGRIFGGFGAYVPALKGKK
jgi:hypothetical protein